MRRQINGILLLDKPVGLTSNGALQQVKRLFCAKKAGHTGSLDPIATGMLPICFGEATKFSQFLLESDKSYCVTAKLGVQTNTGDSEGEVIATLPVVDVTPERVNQVMQKYKGPIQQIPPMFSAIKMQGKPLYELARRGIEVERKPRPVTIHELRLEQVTGDELSIFVHCSKGTYVRTLVEEIGRDLGCGAHVIALRRTCVSPYGEAAMYTMSALTTIAETSGHEGLGGCLLPVETAVRILPEVTLSTSAAFYLRMGQPVRVNFPYGSSLVRLVAEDARFLGVGEALPDGRVKPMRLVE